MANEPTLTIFPAVSGVTPTDRDGILFIVDGPVRPTGAVVVTTSDDVVHARSPEFGQKNRVVKTSSVYDLEVADATGGSFYLWGDDGESNLPQTEDIAFNASASDVQAAIRRLWGQQSILATGGPLNEEAVTLTFVANLHEKDITLLIEDSSLTGDGAAATVTEVTAGGADSSVIGGPYTFGPLHLPAADYTADVLIASGDNEGNSLLVAPTTFTVYEYED